MKVLKTLLIGLLCISLSGCKKQKEPEKLTVQESIEPIQESKEEEIDALEFMTMDEILEVINNHYKETKLTTSVYFDDSVKQIVIEIYDPNLIKQFITVSSSGTRKLNEDKREQWNEYVNHYVEESTEFKNLLIENNFDMFLQVAIVVYYEDFKTVDKGHLTPAIYIIDDSIVFN